MGRVKASRRTAIGSDPKEEKGAGTKRSPETKPHRRIRYYGDPILKTPAKKVSELNPSLLSLVEDMERILAEADGLGLAAQQVGEALAIAVLNLEGFEEKDEGLLADGKTLVLINPEIAEEEGEITDEEGCLSFPGLYVNLTRPERVVVSAQRLIRDRTLPVEIEAKGLFARALCHEIDHLNGVLIIDRLSPFARVRALTQWRLKLAEALEEREE
ncbi:MAG: peptide deformylase [candidate division WOR-3 bacterium]